MAHDVFISCTSEHTSFAYATCAYLESRGLRCWIAPRDIVAGIESGAAITEGIRGATAMVFVVSSGSNITLHVLQEIAQAASHGIPILPLPIEDSVLTYAPEDFAGSTHWLALFPDDIRQQLEKLTDVVALLTETQAAAPPLLAPSPITTADPDGDGPEGGRCQACGLMNELERHTCRNPDCGACLRVACLMCDRLIPVWETVCGTCGGAQPALTDERLATVHTASSMIDDIDDPPPLLDQQYPAANLHRTAPREMRLFLHTLMDTPPIRNSIGIELKLIPTGTFMMGEADGSFDINMEGDPDPFLQTVHQVTLTHSFFIGVYPVTNAQWKRVMGTVPSRWQDDNRPVENVSWHEAVDFCRRLSAISEERQAGRSYRLPTEAEWEYACRAGTHTKYSFGSSEEHLGHFAWFYGNSSNQTHPVGQKLPNAWGLYDMHGNVWEWCSDRHDNHGSQTTIDSQGPLDRSSRVERGGSWNCGRANCRAAVRHHDPPSNRLDYLGCRVVMSLTEAVRVCGRSSSMQQGSRSTVP